jgi:hypothetical protein
MNVGSDERICTVLSTDTKSTVLWIRGIFGVDYFLKVHLHHFSKKSQNSRNKVFLTIFT